MSTESLSSLAAFVRAAETRSYVAASRLLGVSASAVGKSVSRLEDRLGVRLLQRSTRSIRLTAEGELFFDRCQRILADLGDAEAELLATRGAPRGRLRVSTPAATHRLLLPIAAAFTRKYPEVQLDVDYDDRIVDVIEEGFDVVLRSGPLADSRLTARRVGDFRYVLVGARAYLRRRGTPRKLADLADHDCLFYRLPANGKVLSWEFEPAPAALPDLRATMTCNSIEAIVAAARGGMGIAYLPDFVAREGLADRSLVHVLPPITSVTGSFRLVWPASRHLSPKVRAFVSFVSERLFTGPRAGRSASP